MKKSTLFISICLFVIISGNLLFAQMEVQTGKYRFDPTISNYNLANGGDVERIQQMVITFPKSFKTTPQIILSVTKYDGDKGSNTRFDVKVASVSKSTFQIEAKTWGGSKIYLLAGEWMAIGE